MIFFNVVYYFFLNSSAHLSIMFIPFNVIRILVSCVNVMVYRVCVGHNELCLHVIIVQLLVRIIMMICNSSYSLLSYYLCYYQSILQ